jgi:hypothetical protein
MFVEHQRLGWRDREAHDLAATNLAHEARGPEEAWIEDAASRIGDWRSLTRSVYLRWAITINATVLAEQRYRALPEGEALWTNTLRAIRGAPEQVPLAIWPAGLPPTNMPRRLRLLPHTALPICSAPSKTSSSSYTR